MTVRLTWIGAITTVMLAFVSPAHSHAYAGGAIFGTASDDRGVPVADVLVGLRRADGKWAATICSDERGRFEFDDVAPGALYVGAKKFGYTDAIYRSPAGHGDPGLQLASGERVRADLRLVRNAVVSGTVRAPSGEPATGALVHLEMLGASGDAATSGYDGSMNTDDRGAFRIANVPAGTYVLAALSAVAANGDRSLRQIDASGAERTFSDAPVYYPGVSHVADAATIVLRPGDDRAGFDLRLVRIETTSIRGVVVGDDGQPVAGNVRVHRGDAAGSDPRDQLYAGDARVDRGGQFEFDAVPGGDVLIGVRATPRRPVGASGATLDLWGALEISVDGRHPVSDQVIRVTPGVAIEGDVQGEPGSSPLPPYVEVTLEATPGPFFRFADFSETAGADDRFRVTSAPPGVYTVGLGHHLEDWRVAGVSVDGKQVTDGRIAVNTTPVHVSMRIAKRGTRPPRR